MILLSLQKIQNNFAVFSFHPGFERRKPGVCSSSMDKSRLRMNVFARIPLVFYGRGSIMTKRETLLKELF